MARVLILLSSLLLSACVTPPPPLTGPGDVTSISYDVFSWGRPVIEWQVSGDGDVTIYAGISEAANGDLSWTRTQFTVDPAELGQLVAILDAMRQPRDGELQYTDAAYGNLTVARGGIWTRHSFNFGYDGKYYTPFLNDLGRLDALVASWARTRDVQTAVIPVER